LASFDLLSFFTRLLGGLNISGLEAQAVSWLKEQGAKYPDLAERTDALAIWLQTTIAEATPGLAPEAIANTAKGIATDIVNGTAGVDPDAWQGGV